MSVNKVAFTFNPFKETGIAVAKEDKADALAEVKDYVLEQVLSHVGEGKSPVDGGRWKRSLTKEYAKVKKGQSSAKFANLELSGDMLDALDVAEVNSEKLSLQVKGAQAGKAEGNNIGSYGKSADPSKAREFIPQPGGAFNNKIQSGIERILKKYEKD